jgi:hypothetical protein
MFPNYPLTSPIQQYQYDANNLLYGIGGIEEEEPLLKELGFDFDHIRKKIRVVMNPFTRELDDELKKDADLAGPLCLSLILGMIQMLTMKLTFGYIYGISLSGSVLVWGLVNLMSDPSRGDSGVGLYQTISIMGYSLLPIIMLATVSIFVSLVNAPGMVISFFAMVWATSSSSMMFSLCDRRLLLAYPLGLYYTYFILYIVF